MKCDNCVKYYEESCRLSSFLTKVQIEECSMFIERKKRNDFYKMKPNDYYDNWRAFRQKEEYEWVNNLNEQYFNRNFIQDED